MPLPPDIDPLGLSYAEGPFDDAPPWPPPEWLEQPADSVVAPAPPVVDDLAGAPAFEQQALPQVEDPFAQSAPLTDELGGAPDPFALPPGPPQPMPWETQPGELAPVFDAGPQQPGVRDIPGLSFYEHREQAAPQPLSYLVPGDSSAPLPSMREEQVRDPFAGMTDAQGLATARALPPEQLAELEGQREYLRQKQAIARQLEIEDQNIARAEENRRMRETAAAKADSDTQQIIADAKALADKGIDRKAWFGKLDTFGKIGAVVGALTGGLMSKAGGPNHGIDFIDKLVNADIEEQKYEIGLKQDALKTRQGAVAQAYQRSGDLFMAAETARLATYNALINKMKTEQQNFDPRGTMFLNHAKTIQQMQARAAHAEVKIRQQRFENRLKEGKFELERQQQAEIERNNRAQNALRAREIEEQRKQREAAAQAKAEEKAAEKADKEEERDRQFSVGTPRPALKLDDKGKPVLGPDGKPELITQRLVNKDGKPWRLGSNEENKEMKAKITAASEITDMIDEVLDIREKVGGEIMPWSDAKQRLALLQERMRLVRKSGTQGMSSDKDFEALGASIGAKNLNSFIDQSPGLKEARERTISELNTQMRTANYTGPALSFENRYVGAKNTPEDDKHKRLIEDRGVSLDQELKQNIDKAVADRGYALDLTDPADQALYRSIRDQTQAGYTPGAASDQRADIAELGRAAAAGDPDALAVLNEIATKAHTSKLKALAKAQIEALKPAAPSRGPQSAPVVVPDELRLP